MSQYFQIHPQNPQLRLINQAVKIILSGGIVAYPTDSAYALGCHIGDKAALDRIRRIRQLPKDHMFTLICRDLSELATYAKVTDNTIFRMLKAHTPGPYTFLLPATREVPNRLQHPKRKTIGLRVPDHPITQALLAQLGEPLMSVTLEMPNEEFPLVDPEEMHKRLAHQVDVIIDGGPGSLELTTLVSFTDHTPEVIRVGKGDPSDFLL